MLTNTPQPAARVWDYRKYRILKVAKNSGNTSSKKKNSNKSKASRSRKSSTGKMRTKTAKGRNPAYVLIIMILLTSLALLVNKIYDKTATDPKKDHHRGEEGMGPGNISDSKKESGRKQDVADVPDKTDSRGAPTKDNSAADLQIEKPSTEEIRLYFIRFNEKTEKMYLFTVVRKVDKRSILENTMRELIKGPSASEKKKGLLSAVPPDLRLNGVRVKHNTAELDFNGAIERGAGGSVLLNRVDQIVYTATQFPSVKSVVIKINGRKRLTLGSDGLSIEGPLHRRQ
jgi:spore germination protein GerM